MMKLSERAKSSPLIQFLCYHCYVDALKGQKEIQFHNTHLPVKLR